MEVIVSDHTRCSDTSETSPKLTCSLKLKRRIKKILISKNSTAPVIQELDDLEDLTDIKEILDLISHTDNKVSTNISGSPNPILSPRSAKREFIIRKSLQHLSPRQVNH